MFPLIWSISMKSFDKVMIVFYLRVYHISDDEDDTKRVVRSAKDKR